MNVFFYFRYALTATRKHRLTRLLTVLLTAAAVAFTATGLSYFRTTSDTLSRNNDTIIDLVMTVTDPVAPIGSDELLQDSNSNRPLTDEMLKAFAKIDGVTTVAPSIVFPQVSAYSTPMAPLLDENDKEARAELLQQNRDAWFSRVTLENADGLSEELLLCTTGAKAYDDIPPEAVFTEQFSAISYPSREYAERRCVATDASCSDGGYLSERFAAVLGVTADDLRGLTVSVELMVPACRIEQQSSFYNENNEPFLIDDYAAFFTRRTVTFPVRGILREERPEYQVYAIYLPPEEMEETIHLAETECRAEAENYCARWNHYRAENQTGGTEGKIIPWAANTCFIAVESPAVYQGVKEALYRLNPNFLVISAQHDLEAESALLDNNSNLFLYAGWAVLLVVLLPITLIYVNLLDKRRHELALLRANGLTRREIRRLISAEMAVLFLAVTVMGSVFAIILYLLGKEVFDYSFTLDGVTFLRLSLIAFGAILVPTAVSLGFVGRYEPDRVMRN